jgi:transglutaminase-like putative cysteine protease
MKIRIGFEISYEFTAPTPVILQLNVHPSRRVDLLRDDEILCTPARPLTRYRDRFDNICCRMVAMPGLTTFRTESIVKDTGLADPVVPDAMQHAVEDLPPETLVYLQGSRYCETDLLTKRAWELFAHTPPGWPRVQAICDFVHNHLEFGYKHARATRSAAEAMAERKGVCRDFAHLAVALCRCMNIPARYCTGYLGDIGVPLEPDPMDFSAWFEAYLGGRWYTFDARHNHPRIGRIVIARGRDAADVAISTGFGFTELVRFAVVTEEVEEARSEFDIAAA